MTALAEKLKAQIRADGPMTVASYMAACLGDPTHGYYMTREPFGRGGDFTTSPEVSQMFGELIGAWAIATWRAMGAPASFVLAELGPGRGTLIADVLRTGRVAPAFLAAARVHLVETSPRLRKIQAETITGLPTWHARIDDLPAAPMILIANEFFDALPIRQFVRSADGWAERMVGLDENGALAFGLRPAALPLASPSGETPPTDDRPPQPPDSAGKGPPPAQFAALTPGDAAEAGILEVSPAATAIMSAIGARLMRQGGAALVIDYGHSGPAFGDTLQAVRHHEHDGALAHPGEADLTAHVDFGALAAAASAAGARPRALVSQGDFLRDLGIGERSAALARGKAADVADGIVQAAERLAGREAMGGLFKVLAIASRGLALPIFDRASV